MHKLSSIISPHLGKVIPKFSPHLDHKPGEIDESKVGEQSLYYKNFNLHR